ncbi:class I SAM-dependent RNA methyltransferase [Anaeromyxobacter sp. SG17]|uniref:THUMP domain-containing class I SAM-dependent RNA methyltransferase n=1 Tax=Anaeromyxobacter sp. SG17 TaxID=2925405 RepID=UPI001F59D20E|nr:RNA methyltransferase [Anaeromyxobacter sp. SG17]
MSRSERIFCACAPGLEPVLAAELAALGLAARALPGGAEAEGEDAAALACLASRAADAVLLRLWEGDPAELPAAKRAAARRAGGAALEVRTGRGRATLSVDAAGAPLFRRGWRARIGAAPLRESLAAGILLACGWKGDRPFLDPMCGSGTIAIEAALAAGRRAPGLGRSFAFERLPGHDAARTERLRARLAAQARPIAVAIHASDRNAGALRLAQKNAAAAGVADAIRFERADAARVEPPPGPGLCAVNPPYGVRLDEDAALAWRALGALFPRLRGWEVAVLGPDRGYERLLPLAPASALPVRNGGLACRLLRLSP